MCVQIKSFEILYYFECFSPNVLCRSICIWIWRQQHLSIFAISLQTYPSFRSQLNRVRFWLLLQIENTILNFAKWKYEYKLENRIDTQCTIKITHEWLWCDFVICRVCQRNWRCYVHIVSRCTYTYTYTRFYIRFFFLSQRISNDMRDPKQPTELNRVFNIFILLFRFYWVPYPFHSNIDAFTFRTSTKVIL